MRCVMHVTQCILSPACLGRQSPIVHHRTQLCSGEEYVQIDKSNAARPSATGWLWVVAAALSALPGVVAFFGLSGLPEPVRGLLFGVAIVGSAFLLSWAAEAAQLDFSQGLCLALLALIAILPEYVVDASFAWLAAEDASYAGYAVANMTGANRLLIGIAWPLVLALAFIRFRQRQVKLEEGHGMEVLVLLAATIYAFVLPLKGNLTLIDMLVLMALFGFYMWRVSRLPCEAPHLVGPARLIGVLPKWKRRIVILAIAMAAALTILVVAKPFAKSLVASGLSLGIDEFLLVQWLAPLASEAPEFVIVALFAWRGASTAAFGTLVSSKINQWTLLVGMLPLVYAIAKGGPVGLPLDERQKSEIFLTAAQSLFAITLLLNLRLTLVGAGALLSLFLVQMIAPETRLAVTITYLALTAVVLLVRRREVGLAFRWLKKP